MKKYLLLGLLCASLARAESIYLVTPTIDVTTSHSVQTTEFYNNIHKRIGWYKRYPLLAQMRGIEGDVIIYAVVDNTGKVVEASVNNSSGTEMIDKGGIDTIYNASPFIAPPSELMTDNKVKLLVPISFKLVRS
jgi:protein TonB